MAWITSHLFVHTSDRSAVERELTRLLELDQHRTDLEHFDELPDPLVICPPHEGWIAVTGVGAWFDDLPWVAAELCRACATRVASSEVFGNCYRLQLSIHDADQAPRVIRSPEAPTADGRPIPLYEDVELRAFSTLCELGLPAALIAVGTVPLGAGDPQDIGSGVTLMRSEGIVRGERSVRLPALPVPTEPPVIPTRVTQDFGLATFEDRYLEGQPTQPGLQRLFELEQAFNLRLARALCSDQPETPPGDPRSTFVYFAGVNQDRLNSMLQAHDHHTLPTDHRVRPPWWQFWRHVGKWR